MDTKATKKKTKRTLEAADAFFVNVPRGMNRNMEIEMFLSMMDMLKEAYNALQFHHDRDANVIGKVVMSSLKMAIAIPTIEEKVSKSTYSLLHRMGFTPDEITKALEGTNQ